MAHAGLSGCRFALATIRLRQGRVVRCGQIFERRDYVHGSRAALLAMPDAAGSPKLFSISAYSPTGS
jgi:hypothetical protein